VTLPAPATETLRLRLRPPRPTDVDPLFEIQGNPEAMRFTWCAPDRRGTSGFLDSYAERFAEDGFAPWTAVLKGAERVVGWGGLHKDPHAPERSAEVSYFIHPACWGQGLASELVQAALRLAFAQLRLREVAAYTRCANGASRRVLEKAGFVWLRQLPGLEREHFEIRPGRWRRLAREAAARARAADR